MNKDRVSGFHIKFKQLMHFCCQLGELRCKMAVKNIWKKKKKKKEYKQS